MTHTRRYIDEKRNAKKNTEFSGGSAHPIEEHIHQKKKSIREQQQHHKTFSLALALSFACSLARSLSLSLLHTLAAFTSNK